MSNDRDFTIEGLIKTLNKLDKVGIKAKRIVKQQSNSFGIDVYVEASRRTPVDIGNLRASEFIISGQSPTIQGGFSGDDAAKIGVDTYAIANSAKKEINSDRRRGIIETIVGFGAYYAYWLHENLEQKLKGKPRTTGSKKGVYWETGEPKFLENGVKAAGGKQKLRSMVGDALRKVIRREWKKGQK